MTATSERVSINLPAEMARQAREKFPQTRGMSAGRLLRFVLAKALGMDDVDAMRATLDARIGTHRQNGTDA